jgi:hypothetical protein
MVDSCLRLLKTYGCAHIFVIFDTIKTTSNNCERPEARRHASHPPVDYENVPTDNHFGCPRLRVAAKQTMPSLQLWWLRLSRLSARRAEKPLSACPAAAGIGRLERTDYDRAKPTVGADFFNELDNRIDRAGLLPAPSPKCRCDAGLIDVRFTPALQKMG